MWTHLQAEQQADSGASEMGGYGNQIASDMVGSFQQAKAQKKNRQEQMQDEERNNKLQVYANLHNQGRIGTSELGHAIEDIYHDAEPEKKMNIFRRLLNRQKATKQHDEYLQGKQKRATEEQGILSGAKEPGQAEGDADTAKKKAAITALKTLFPEATPEQLNTLKMHILGGASAGTQAPYKEFSSPDGKQRVWARVGEEPDGWNATQGEAKTGKPRPAWKKDANGKFSSVLLDPVTNQPIPGTENGDVQPPAGMQGRITTGFYHFVDDEGKVHQVEETHTSMPVGSGSQPKSGGKGPAPKAAATKSGGAAGDKVLGRKDTAVTTKAKKDYVDAVKLDSVATQVEQNPQEAVNQKRLAVALERQAAGRFTTQALDYIRQAGWSAGAEQFWNNIDNGTLPDTVIRQLIKGAHQNLKAAKDAMDAAENLGAAPAPKGGKGGAKRFVDKGQPYDIPADKVDAFKKAHPNATESN